MRGGYAAGAASRMRGGHAAGAASRMRGGHAAGAASRMRGGHAAGAADRLLDGALVAFAGWTAIYHACLVLRIGTAWAAAAWAVVLVGAAWLVLRGSSPPAPPPGAPSATPRRAWWVLPIAGAALAIAAGATFGLARTPYATVWKLWLAAAACALAWTTLRLRAARSAPEADAPPAGPAPRSWVEPAVVAAWAIGLAVFSLFLRGPDPDDAFYVHLSAWTAVHGQFPLRDVTFSDQVLPALYYPPTFSYEGLVGTLSRIGGSSAADLTYRVVPPLGSALSVLAFWRLLRAWRVPMVALALSVAMVFLLFDAAHHMTYGSFFVARMWQGKVLLLTILVPVLLALLHGYADRPTWRGFALLVLAGAAGVGLSTTAIFLVPVIAAGCMLPVALRSLRSAGHAAAGLVAAAAYPVGAGVVTKLSAGRTPDVYTLADVVAPKLVHYVLGTGGFALLGLAAALLAPVLLPRASAGQMLAGTALLTGVLLSPSIPTEIFDLTGLGRVLWRLTWALPVAALVGALATSVAGRRGHPALRATPAVALCLAMVLFGEPPWWASGGTEVASRPVLKRAPTEVADARRILAHAQPGDLILAPRPLSQTLLVLSGDVTTVSPRGFFVRALSGIPAMHAMARRGLQHFVRSGFAPHPAGPRRIRALHADLRALGVDIACVDRSHVEGRRVLGTLGFTPLVRSRRTACSHAPSG